MLQVLREGSALVVRIDHGLLGNNGHLQFRWQAGNDLLADALVRQVQAHLGSTIMAIRQEEYNQGWKHAKSHNQTKKTWFWAVLKKEG